MKRRTTIGLLAVLAGGLLTGAGALAFGGHHAGRHGVMKRFVSATIDDALDQAKVTPAQRTAIHAARDRVLAAAEQHWQARGSGMDEALRLFEADEVDLGRVAALRQAREEEHRRVVDVIEQAIVEVHDTLTPAQRTAVAGYVRAHHRRHLP